MNTGTIRARIFSHMTQTRFLHIEDDLPRGKLRFFIGSFERGKGASITAYAFLDIDDARVVLSDLAMAKAVDFTDYKGGKDGSGIVISRVLKIKTKEESDLQSSVIRQKVWIEIHNGSGLELSGGAIKPNGQPFAEISIPLTIFEGRKLAHACLAYIHAFDVRRALNLSQNYS